MKIVSVWGCLLTLIIAHDVVAPPARADTPARPDNARADTPRTTPSLAGSWTLVAADVRRPDGSVVRDYGANPKGMMLIDAQGRYQVQIYKTERPRFASPDRAKGTPAEFQAAVLGQSCHFGTVRVDAAKQVLIYQIEGAAFPNWEGAVQERRFELRGDELRYEGVPRPDGAVPITVWRRLK